MSQRDVSGTASGAKRVGPYTLGKPLDSGGNASVFRATDANGESVAIKLLRRPGREPSLRFVREIEQWRDLGEVPGVVKLVDYYLPPTPGDGPAYLVMPILTPLPRWLRSRWSVDTVVDVIAQVAQTLADLHDRPIYHRDVKPDNLLVDMHDLVLLGDFGLVDAPDVAPITTGDKAVGSRFFIAPEMINAPDAADGGPVDVYGLGKTLWVLLTRQHFPLPGEHPPHGDTRASLFFEHPRGPELDNLIYVMTRNSPTTRPTLRAVADELRSWASEAPPPPSPVSDYAAIKRRIDQAAAHHETAATQRAIDERAISEAADVLARGIEQFVLEFSGIVAPQASERRETQRLLALHDRNTSGTVPHDSHTEIRSASISRTGAYTILLAFAVARKFPDAPDLELVIGWGIGNVKPTHASPVPQDPEPRLVWSQNAVVLAGGPATTQSAQDLVSQLRENFEAAAEIWREELLRPEPPPYQPLPDPMAESAKHPGFKAHLDTGPTQSR
jgi:serine/threonine protein kinase